MGVGFAQPPTLQPSLVQLPYVQGQSAAHVDAVSLPVQQPSPQTSVAQSLGQEHLVSPALQTPLLLHRQGPGQSAQLQEVSPAAGSHTPLLLHPGQQSPGQLAQVSQAVALHTPLLLQTAVAWQVACVP